MHLIAIDLIGKFKPLPQGHQCALTVIDMMINNTLCIVLHTKEADEVVHV